MQVARLLICIAIIGIGICAACSRHSGSSDSLWGWYWNDQAQIQTSSRTRMGGITDAISFIDDSIDWSTGAIWNPLMRSEIVRAGYLLLIGGAVFGAGAQLVSFNRKEPPIDHEQLLKDIEQTKRELAQVQQDRSSETPEWLQQAQQDPNSALTEFRRQIEIKLRALAQPISARTAKRDLAGVIKLLEDRKVIDEFHARTLTTLRKELNAAAHEGIESKDAQQLLLSMAPQVLGYLDSLKEARD